MSDKTWFQRDDGTNQPLEDDVVGLYTDGHGWSCSKCEDLLFGNVGDALDHLATDHPPDD